MKVLGKQIYRFEGVELDPSQGCLRRDGEELRVRQKTLRALLYLLEERHRLVTKEELIGRVWEGLAVTDDALVQLIKELRRSLGDDPRRPRFIKTVPKGGYRFIAPVEELFYDPPGAIEVERHASVEIEFEEEIGDAAEGHVETETRSHPLPRPAARPRRRRLLLVAAAATLLVTGALTGYLMKRSRTRSGQAAEITLPRVPGKSRLAVMYFENRSGGTGLDWLREGLADMLITDLSRSQKLSVLGRQQLHLLLERADHDPRGDIRLDEALDVARRVQAEQVALGSFAQLDGRMRVDVQLYDVREGRLLTSEHLVVEEPAQLLTQVGLLSLKLASHLGVSAEQEKGAGLTGVMTDNLAAYRHYTLGVEKANELLYAEAVASLEEAVRLDPEFAMAHARIGYTYALCWVRPDEAKPHLEKAFQLSGRLTEKDRLSITAWYAVAHQDYSAAIETYRKIISLDPLEVEAYWRLSRLLRGEERMEESVEAARQGLAVDSEAKDLYNVLGVTYMEMGRHDEAIATFRRYIELAPDDPNIYDSLGMAYQWAGRYAEAIQTFEKALSLNPRFEIAILHLGNTYVWQGRYGEALRQYRRFIEAASYDGSRARGSDAIALLHFKREKFDEAERAARAALKYDKRAVGPSLLLALERGDLATAEKLMAIVETNHALDRGNRGYERHRAYLRGYAALKSGRAADAVEHFKEAVRHRPMAYSIDPSEDCLANAYLELGRPDETIAEYERILRLNPNYPLAHYRLAQAYERKGWPAEAHAHYERFLGIWKEAEADLPEVVAVRERLN
jgi:tetratricopeptide (TPR) repeat protein/DNA-binding winged helix-turn-helix (wHTH) protein